MVRNRMRVFLMPLLVILLLSLSRLGTAAGGPLNIVATTTDLASIARSVGGLHVKVSSLCSGREDPHFLTPKPSFIVLARDADLWIRIGMGLEVGWEPPILEGARNRKIMEGMAGHLDVSEDVIKLEVPTARVTRAMGDVHPEGNPHHWLDPFNGRMIAEAVASRLSQLAPEHAKDFQKNLVIFQNNLEIHMFGAPLVGILGGETLWAHQLKGDLDTLLTTRGLRDHLGGWTAMMKPFEGKAIVIQHRSWLYFTNRFGLVIGAELEPKPGIPPSAAHLQSVIETVTARGIKLILLEPFYERKPADLVAVKTGAKAIVCANSVGGDPEATDYLALIDLIVKRVSSAL